MLPSSANFTHPLEYDALMDGFRKWPERTTTSPSGRHLGIYKSLLKDKPPTDPPADLPPRTYGQDVMHYVYRLLQLALRHTHVFERWRTVWNMYLEKKPGNPQIDLLRTLHLFEADYNLLLKWHSSKGFMAKAEHHNTLDDSQGGGRPGRCAIDLACKKMVLFDYVHMTRTTAVDVSIDVARCFDCLIEACENLSCRQQGADLNYLKLHAAMQQLFRYHVKHAHGVSTRYNQHSETNPWYGAGQGAGDACARWIVQANSMISAYNTRANPWRIVNPDHSSPLTLGLDAFIDDTDLMAATTPTQTTPTPIQKVQYNLTLWNDLLQASGGSLNPSKCVWFYFNWTQDARGTNKIVAPPTHSQPITIQTAPDQSTPIRLLQPHEAHRYLGVQFTTDGNCKAELTLFQQRNTKFINLLQQCPFPHKDIHVIYKQCYLPTVSYPLPATTMPTTTLYRLQSPATSVFLTKLGYPRTFPRAVTYAASERGGLGFRHLGHEQGVQKCLQILKHLRAKTTISQVYEITLNHYQLTSGLSQPILEDTRPILWSTARWVNQLREYLHTIKGQIRLRNPWHPPARREHDRHIMDDVLHLQVSKRQALQIQHVRLFLRVTTLSDIVDHRGTHVIPAMIYPVPAAQYDQHYRQNASTMQWPTSHPPGPAAWRTWRTFITWMYLQPDSYRLQHPLGRWLPTYQQDYQWRWRICPRTQVLFHYDQQQWWAYLPVRHYHTHIGYRNRCSLTSAPILTVPVTPILFALKIHVTLPVSSIVQPPVLAPDHRSLATRLTTPPDSWAETLWHNIRPHAHTDALRQAITQRHIIRFVSDAAVHTTGYGACAWIIRARQDLWTGEGYVPVPTTEMYSGLAEAYGVYMILSFFLQYTRLYPLTISQPRPIHVYCDNAGVITRINNHRNVLQPRDTVRDDYPIFAEIHQLQHYLQPYQFEFHHVKGHQDRKTNHQLSIQERLNIDCDKRVSQLPPPPSDMTSSTHPQLSASFPHLSVDGVVVTQKIQHVLRDAATKLTYFEYLTAKFPGITDPAQTIHWPTIRLALKRFKTAERRIISKFIHEWLPLNARHQSSTATQVRTCPSCRQTEETVDHFFACRHNDRQQIWKDLHEQLYKHQIKNSVSNIFHDLLATGLYHSRGEPTHLTFNHAPNDILQLHQQQESMGWRQLYYGRVSPSWIGGLQDHHPQINGTLYYTQCVTYIWKAVLRIWQLRNQHQHPSSYMQEDRRLLEEEVHRIFQEAQQDPLLQEMVANITPEQILSRPTRRVRQWTTNSKNHIRAHHKASQLRAKLKTQDIRTFFPRLTTSPPNTSADKNLLRPP